MKKLWHGEHGLAMTFWLWWLIGNGVVATALSLVPVPGIGLLTFFYYVASCVGVWRAGTHYDGPQMWTVLSRVMLFAVPVLMVIVTMLVFGAVFAMLVGRAN